MEVLFIVNIQLHLLFNIVHLVIISGASATNTITFQSASGDSTNVILTYASTDENSNYTLKLDSADYITFKEITLQATGATYARIVELDHGACNNNFSNSKILSNYIHSNSSGTGIYLTELSDGDTISNNIIQLPAGGTGINLYFCFRPSPDTSLISNNFVLFETSSDWSGCGMSVSGSDFSVCHNTVKISGTSDYHHATFKASVNELTLVNNILLNMGGGKVLSCDTIGLTSDYNDLYTTGNILVAAGLFYGTLSEYQAATGRDTHSISREPQFLSATNLHTTDPWLNNIGTPLAEVTTDIDGEARDPVSPDIGADEFEAAIYILGDNVNACAYDTVTLDAGNEYDSYSWSNGVATRFAVVDTSGIGLDSLKLVSTVTLGGMEYKDSLWVSFHKPVALTFDIDTCEYNYVQLKASGGVSYHWNVYVTNPDTCCISVYLYNNIRNIAVTVYDSYGCYDTDTATVIPYSKPSQPVIQFSNDSLVSSVTGTGYDWFLNSTTTGNITQAILPQESGDYQVIVYNGGCPSDSSDSYNYIVGIEDLAGNKEITLYPNPTNGKLFMSFEKPFKDLRLSVINLEGRIVLSRLLKDVPKGFITELDLGKVPSGVYFVRFTNKEISRTARIIVR